MSGAMAAAAATASAARPVTVSPTYSSRKQTYTLASSVPVLSYRNPKFHICSSASLVGFGRLPVWSGLKHLGISLRRSTKEAKCKCMGKVVYASLFGVGAPEALVIGVVALLVFGPKGLAEVARNLGKTLRAFQPTIRELQDVSREFKSTLEREIGLDEVQPTLRSTDNLSTSVNEKPKTVADPNGFQANSTPYSSEELLNVTQQQLASTDSEELPKGAVAYQDASTDSTTSPESESEAAASDKVAIENATPDVYSTPATPESNASTTATEPRAAASEMPPTANVPVTNQESQT